jgi:hypothetical protein
MIELANKLPVERFETIAKFMLSLMAIKESGGDLAEITSSPEIWHRWRDTFGLEIMPFSARKSSR